MALEESELCFPDLLNTSCRKPDSPRSETVIVNIVLYSIAAVTAALNLLVIISISHFRHITNNILQLCVVLEICRHRFTFSPFLNDMVLVIVLMLCFDCRKLHTPTNLILLSLAVSDFLVGFLVMPIEVILLGNCWMLSDLMCPLYYLLPITIISSSVGNMLLICVDRYVAICEPLLYHSKVTQKVATGCILLCWTCCVFYSTFLLYENLKQPGRFHSCQGECVIDFLGAVDLALGFVFPISVITLLYMRVFMVAVSQARAMKSQITAVSFKVSKTVRAHKSEVKAATTLGIVVVVFIICYCPYYCVSLTGYTILIGSSIEVFMIFVMYINSCLNPLIYALFYPWFRKAIKIIVTLQILQSNSCEADLM